LVKSVRCSFCGKEIKPGTGIMYVRTDGTIEWFCSRKCYKNKIILKRKPRFLKWARQSP
jgi:large subunit ribosomal protein L24e